VTFPSPSDGNVIPDGAKRRSQMRNCASEVRASHALGDKRYALAQGMTAMGTSRYD
jgi:hypothetical protein